MFGKTTAGSRLAHQLIATLVAIPFAAPLVVIVVTSFGGQGAIANYTAVITNTPILRFILNSLLMSAGTVAVVLVCTLLSGYAFSKLNFRGRRLLFNAILGGLILPVVALLVPMFLFVRTFGLFNNFLAVILPLSAVMIPLTLLLTKNYLDGVPDEILEAARIDGASRFSTLLLIVVPLSRPIIAVVVVWAYLNAWNEFLLPLVFLQDPNLQAVTQVPTYFTSTYGSDVPKIFASLVLMSAPIVAVYLSLQSFFERGLTAGAVK